MNEKQYQEVEVRFLDVDDNQLTEKIKKLGGADLGTATLREIIFYDPQGKWQYDEKKLVRIRSTDHDTNVTYKHYYADTAAVATEIKFDTSEPEAVEQFLQAIGLVRFRDQEKRRHTLKLKEVTIDIDYWPTLPPIVELEGPDEGHLKEVAALLDLPWEKALFEPQGQVIEKNYGLAVIKMKSFTFEKIEFPEETK